MWHLQYVWKKLEPVFKFKKKIIYWKTNSFKDMDRFKRSRKYVFSRETLWMMLFEGQEWLKDRLKHKGCLKRTATPGNSPIPHCATGGCQSFSGFRVIKCHRYHAVCKDMVPYNVREKKPEYIKLFTAAVMPTHTRRHTHTQTDRHTVKKKKSQLYYDI